MSLTTRKLHPLFGAEIVGVDVRTVDEAVFAEIVAAFNEHSVLLFRGQALTDERADRVQPALRPARDDDPIASTPRRAPRPTSRTSPTWTRTTG